MNPDNYVQYTERYSAEASAAMVADGTVTNTPVFNRGYAPMFSRDASEEEVFMALAKYVPALSGAVGGIAVLEDDDKNIDMNNAENGVLRPNGWGGHSANEVAPWKHSDMKDIAYYYVFKLYQQLIEKGGLR